MVGLRYGQSLEWYLDENDILFLMKSVELKVLYVKKDFLQKFEVISRNSRIFLFRNKYARIF